MKPFFRNNLVIILMLVIYVIIRIYIISIYYNDPSENTISNRIYSLIAPESFKLSKKADLSAHERIIGTSDSRKHFTIANNILNYGLPFYSLSDMGYFIIQPGFAFFIAAIYYIGLDIKSILFFQIIFSLFTILMIYSIILKTTSSKSTGLFFVFVSTFFPSLLWIETNLWAEPLYVFLLTSFIYLFHDHTANIDNEQKSHSTVKLGLMAFSIGLACIVRPVATLFPFFIITTFFLCYRKLSIKQRIKIFTTPALFSLFGILIIMLPWSIYTYRMTGVIVWGSGGKVRGKLSNVITNENGYLKKLGKLESTDTTKDDSILQSAIEYIRNIPIRFARLWLGINYDQKISDKNKVLIGTTSLLWILAIIGLYYLIRSKNYLAIVFLFSFVLYVTLIHQIIGQRLRYSIPSLYYLIAMASYGLLTVSQKFKLLIINRKHP